MPVRRAVRTWAGPGSGNSCSVCDLPLKRDEVEFELDFSEQSDLSGNCRVHAHCFAAWEFERRKANR